MKIAEIRGAIGRAYCTQANSHKVLDPDLCEAIAQEIMALLSKKEPQS